jgi:hypothetical protein
LNGFDDSKRVAPVTFRILVDRQFEYEAHSLNVIRIKTRRRSDYLGAVPKMT